MRLIPLISSQIGGAEYDAATRELVIQFHGQAAPVYAYQGVAPELAEGLFAAESPGTYFHRHIRHGPFPYRRQNGHGPSSRSAASEQEP